VERHAGRVARHAVELTQRFPPSRQIHVSAGEASIQVHPDDAYAAAHEQAAGGKGKTEMWHALSSEPGAKLLLGLKAGTDKQKFRDAMKADKLEEVFQAHDVRRATLFL